MASNSGVVALSQVDKNRKGRIVGFGFSDQISNENSPMIKRLRDIGFEEDRIVEIMHAGPLGADPLAVRVEGMMIALRRAEAALINIEMEAL